MAETEFIEREAASRVLCDACGNAACPKGLIPRCSYYEKMQSIPAADARPVKWIPVTEALPEHDKNVLICYEWTGRSRTVYREVGIASIEELERDPTEMFRPLYWMPLPEPPKEE